MNPKTFRYCQKIQWRCGEFCLFLEARSFTSVDFGGLLVYSYLPMPTDKHRPDLDIVRHHSPETRIAGIEMLRAVAVLLVLYQHMPGMLPDLAFFSFTHALLINFNGGAGVDIFFCVSGYVVTRSLRRDLRSLSGRQAVAVTLSFWVRRAFRLWPAAWLWLVVAYFVSLNFNRLGVMDPAANLRLIPAGVGMYANLLLMNASRHHRDLGVMSQYWSLSLEEQFYLTLPLLLIFARRAALPLLIFCAAYCFYEYQDFWFDTYLRPGCLVAGVVLAYCEHGLLWRHLQSVWPSGRVNVALCIGLILLAGELDSIAIFETWFGLPMFRLAAPLETLACLLIVFSATQHYGLAGDLAWRRVLTFLGSRSYVIYVVHQLAYAIARETDFRLFSTSANFMPRFAVAVTITLTLIAFFTELTVRYIEQPMRERGRELAATMKLPANILGRSRIGRVTQSRLIAYRSASGRQRIVDIEALRTIAIAFVIVEHATGNLIFNPKLLLGILEHGQFWPGVDLFFVISGFLVTSDLLRRFDSEQGRQMPWRVMTEFLIRRIWRLWPTAWLWLLLILVGSAALVEPPVLGAFNDNVGGALAGVFLYANYSLAHHIQSFRLYGSSYAYWSLSLEEQFYLLLPIAIRFFGRYLALGVCLAILIQLPLAHNVYYYFFRSDALLWGVALALWRTTPGYKNCSPSFLEPRWAGSAVLVLALISLFRVAGVGNITPPFIAGGIAAISALLVWIASYDRHYLCPPFAQSLVMWGGSRSYAIYVAHVPVFQCSAALAHYIFTPSKPLFSGAGNRYALVIVVPLMMVAVELTHRFVEKPLRRLGSRDTIKIGR